MYRSCIFCSAPLGSNDSIERFPVGRSLAFDASKGRLWAVCPRCARWNLAPIEERWEAIEDAERLFRATRLRAQRENIGIAKLRDGTRLVRVGEAMPGELAVWRYGETLARRHRRWLLRSVPVTLGSYGFYAVGMVAGMGAYFAYRAVEGTATLAVRAVRERRLVLEARAEDGSRVRVRRGDLRHARLAGEGGALELHLPPSGRGHPEARPLVLRGPEALMALGRGMVDVNARGATDTGIHQALEKIRRAGSAEDFLRSAARRRLRMDGLSLPYREVRKMTFVKRSAATTRARARPGFPRPAPSRWRWRCTKRRSAAFWTASCPR